MGLLDDLKKTLSSEVKLPVVGETQIGSLLALPAAPFIAPIAPGVGAFEFGRRQVRGGGFPEGFGQPDETGLGAMLDMSFATRTQEVNDQLSKARTPEEFLAANQAGLELFALLNQRESLLASGTALTELQQLFDESDDSEIAIGQLDTLLSNVNTSLTPEGQIADSLSDEDQQFQDLLRRGTELDVLLKEQQLAEAQRQQEFAGVFNLLDVLPAKQRADVVVGQLHARGALLAVYGLQGLQRDEYGGIRTLRAGSCAAGGCRFPSNPAITME